MFKKRKSEKTTYGIIGLGKFGMSLALALAEAGEEILAIDDNEDNIREIREYTENAFLVQNLDKKTLTETGIQNCEVAIVCIGEKMDISILTTLNLVNMGISKVIAKAHGAEHGIILKKLGADVVYPEHDMALRLASRLQTSSVLDFVQLSEKINVSKLDLPRCFEGKTVIDCNLRGKFGLNIIGIENDGSVIEAVTPDYIFRKNDILFLSGSSDGLVKLFEYIEKNSQ